jgi:hypothetical protein
MNKTVYNREHNENLCKFLLFNFRMKEVNQLKKLFLGLVALTMLAVFGLGQEASAEVQNVPKNVWVDQKGEHTLWHLSSWLTREEGIEWEGKYIPERIQNDPIAYQFKNYIDAAEWKTLTTTNVEDTYGKTDVVTHLGNRVEGVEPSQVPANAQNVERVEHAAANKAEAMSHEEWDGNGFVNEYDTWLVPFSELDADAQAEVLAHPDVYHYHEVDGVMVCNPPVRCFKYYTYNYNETYYTYKDCLYLFGFSWVAPTTRL